MASELEAIALLRRAWWEKPKLERDITWREPQRIFLKHCYRQARWKELVSCKHGEMLEAILKNADTAAKSLDVLWHILDGSPETFLHRDPHGGNIFYARDGRLGLLERRAALRPNSSQTHLKHR
ncbi:phosphotransferase [Henriciella aquimarina]|uniref:phosphotransferase n=1 Tax=Henriciella aquimarina TaxID=545261 RepID=UPI000A01CD74